MSAPAKRKTKARAAEPAPQAEAQGGDWIVTAEAARIMDRTVRAVRKLAAAGHIRTHQPPGLIARYYKPDVLKFAPAAALAES